MKKIRALVMVLLATAALGFMGCSLVSTSNNNTYTGTVKVKIFNNADVPLTVSSITEYCNDDVLGTYGQENTISVNGNKEFEISCSTSSDYFLTAEKTKINCYCTSGSSVVYPYAGYINGTSVTISTSTSNGKTNNYEFNHSTLELKTSNPGTITVVYNFVKTTGGDYVLCKVE